MTQDEKFIDEIELSLLAYKIIVMDNDMELAKEVEEEITWLKSLKDKLRSLSKQDEQKHQEEDDVELTDFEADLFSAFSDGWQTYLFDKEGLDVAQWAREHSSELLESAKRTFSEWSEEDTETPQKRWKPSDEQMKALDSAIHYYAGISPTNNREVYALKIMKEQLKKLREK